MTFIGLTPGFDPVPRAEIIIGIRTIPDRLWDLPGGEAL